MVMSEGRITDASARHPSLQRPVAGVLSAQTSTFGIVHGEMAHPSGFEPEASTFGELEHRPRHGLMFYAKLRKSTLMLCIN